MQESGSNFNTASIDNVLITELNAHIRENINTRKLESIYIETMVHRYVTVNYISEIVTINFKIRPDLETAKAWVDGLNHMLGLTAFVLMNNKKLKKILAKG